MEIHWYPGHMAKTKRLIKEKLPLIDIIYEVIDARIPYSSKMRGIDTITKMKPRILIMTKIDLCDKETTQQWVHYYERQGYIVVGVDLINNKNIESILNNTKKLLAGMDEKRREKGMLNRRYRALVIGIPNVGKSTLINRLVGKRATNVGDRPGVTKKLEWIRVDEEIELLDSPGILWPKLDEEKVALNLASFRAIKEEVLPLDTVCTYILNTLHTYYPKALESRYGELNITEDMVEAFDAIGKKRGAILRGGYIDYKKVYSTIISDLMDGKLGQVTFDRMKGE